MDKTARVTETRRGWLSQGVELGTGHGGHGRTAVHRGITAGAADTHSLGDSSMDAGIRRAPGTWGRAREGPGPEPHSQEPSPPPRTEAIVKDEVTRISEGPPADPL